MRLKIELPRDPRILQIAFLATFLIAGITLYDIVPPWEPPLALAGALSVQSLCARLAGAPDAGLRSAMITGLGLSILLRSDVVWIPPLAAALAISSKFAIRVRGKHVFNPATFGLVAVMVLTRHAWLSPSQWGEDGVLLFWFVALGLAVAHRSFRSDTSLAFLLSWVGLKAGRVFWLGQRPEVLLHQLESGSLIVFAFFMISDPKTTPDRRAARILHAALVAVLAFTLQHHYWVMSALPWALFALSPMVPLADRVLGGARFQWPRPIPHSYSKLENSLLANHTHERNLACARSVSSLP